MRGIDWQALPLIAEYLAVQDIELFIRGLLHIREYQEQVSQI
jgi:hypothetical protein